ncbi:hypothetical protein [Methylomonas methanica]|uniref:Uncharacterized protein n=1 Tax=Methylomonas methanica (strain DSM 25384 / MC09) TaxID=857087 RepID=F9ZZ90_METMM|nr:hypothetical protein [Methylomonas methanica]AEG01116.1 hypothetical protein Metme_2733 [Methylomonas methanica MC09]
MSTKIQTSLRLEAEKLAEAKQMPGELGMNFSEAALRDVHAGQVPEAITLEQRKCDGSKSSKPFRGRIPSSRTCDTLLIYRADEHPVYLTRLGSHAQPFKGM